MSGLDLTWSFSASFLASFLIVKNINLLEINSFVEMHQGWQITWVKVRSARRLQETQIHGLHQMDQRLIHYTAVVPLPGWGLHANPSPNEQWIPYITWNSSLGRGRPLPHRNLQDGKNIWDTKDWDLSPCFNPSKYFSSSHTASSKYFVPCCPQCSEWPLQWPVPGRSCILSLRGLVRTAELLPKHITSC